MRYGKKNSRSKGRSSHKRGRGRGKRIGTYTMSRGGIKL